MSTTHQGLTTKEAECGHNPGTAAPESLVDRKSTRSAKIENLQGLGWPRLLDVHQAAAYLNLSFWTFRELLNAGTIPTVRVPRPQTLRMRERRAASDTLRRLLIDRADLDALVERWKEA